MDNRTPDNQSPVAIAQGDALFDDGKDPQALRTIGEVAKALGIKPHVLRYWEEQFTALQPIKRSGSRRYYRPEDVALIGQIYRLVHLEGYTLRGAAKALGGKLATAAPAELPQPDARIHMESSMIARLAAIRDELAAALARA